MNKKKKFITDAMQMVGVSAEIMIYDWIKQGHVTLDVLEKIVLEEKKRVANVEVYPGWYAFKGYHFSSVKDAFPNLQGVVADVDMSAPIGKRIKVLVPKAHITTRYQREYGVIGAASEDDGLKNSCIMNIEKEGFIPDGISEDQIFSPAKNQIADCIKNLNAINKALLEIGGDPLMDFEWTSTEVNNTHAWVIYYPDNTFIMMDKKESFPERRMFLL